MRRGQGTCDPAGGRIFAERGCREVRHNTTGGERPAAAGTEASCAADPIEKKDEVRGKASPSLFFWRGARTGGRGTLFLSSGTKLIAIAQHPERSGGSIPSVARGDLLLTVILRPVFGPKDLVLEGARTKGRSLAPFGDAPRSLRSFGMTNKVKIEVLPLRGCSAIAALVRDDKQWQNRGPSRCSGRQ